MGFSGHFRYVVNELMLSQPHPLHYNIDEARSG